MSLLADRNQACNCQIYSGVHVHYKQVFLFMLHCCTYWVSWSSYNSIGPREFVHKNHLLSGICFSGLWKSLWESLFTVQLISFQKQKPSDLVISLIVCTVWKLFQGLTAVRAIEIFPFLMGAAAELLNVIRDIKNMRGLQQVFKALEGLILEVHNHIFKVLHYSKLKVW